MNSDRIERQVPLFLKVSLTFNLFLECKRAHALLARKLSSCLSLQAQAEARTTNQSKPLVSVGAKHSTVEVEECWPFPCPAEINHLFLQETSVWSQRIFVCYRKTKIFLGKKLFFPMKMYDIEPSSPHI